MNGLNDKVISRLANAAFQHKGDPRHLLESFRPGQLSSKKWLVYEIIKYQKSFERVAVLGSWNSVLLYELMAQNAYTKWWDFFDIDTASHEDRDQYFKVNNMKMNYNSFEVDVTEYFNNQDHAKEYDLIINPSCEHMPDIQYQPGPLYALTSCNKPLTQHINPIEDYRDLAIKNGINDVLYEGALKIENYERYCTIGRVINDGV